MRTILTLAAFLVLLGAAGTAYSAESDANEWTKVSDGDLGPGFSPGLVWSPEIKRFIFFGGSLSYTPHDLKAPRPYDVMSFDPADRNWRNELPKGAEARGGEVGAVTDVKFKTPYFEMQDVDGLVRPHRQHTFMWYHYALAPWDNKIYYLVCGRVLRYDPMARTWMDLKAPTGPMPESKSARGGLSWSALCADSVNKEIVLFGGCGLLTADSSPGTWVYSTEKNEWRKLELKVEPPPRALAPMVFDPGSGKIVLFGGDRLDQLYADTWLYDTKTRTWAEAKPALSPSPRFGHALVFLLKSRKVALLGGKGYTSSTSHFALLYRPLPFETWAYDVAKNEWGLVQRIEKGGPPQYPTEAACAAVGSDDTVLFIGAGTAKDKAHSAWTCRLDPSKVDSAASTKFGVAPGTVEFRTGAYDPDWYARDLSAPDPGAAAAVLEKLVPNRWLPLQPPKRPENRGGSWSTVALDTDRHQLLHISGGHSAYYGNDVAHYDIVNGRWNIACRPQFALEYNYDLDGPGTWAFNGAPWGNHNYHAYAYDPVIKRMVHVKEGVTLFYDPATRTWPHTEKFVGLPFLSSKYLNYLVTTPRGVICWTPYADGANRTGLWRMESGKVWKELKLSGEPLPMTVCDGSTITYDSKRDRLLFTTTNGKDGPHGQIWSVDLKTGEGRKLNPEGMDAINGGRFARESAYLPKSDLVMIGFLLPGGQTSVPFYDCEANRWLAADMPGAEFMNGCPGGSVVDLGLAYDAKRDVVWGVVCHLRNANSLNAVRVDRATLGAKPLK